MDLEQITVLREGRTATFNGSWYRGPHTNFIPSKDDLRQADALDCYVMHGFAPSAAFIDRQTPITAFGSCFAANVSQFLGAQGYAVFGRELDLNAHIVRFGEGIVNTFAIRQQFEWALAGREFPQSLWISEDKEIASKDAAVRAVTRDIIVATDVFIITLGLSEIWYDKPTGEAFWRAVPAALFDPERHAFRVTTVDENRDNLRAILDLIAATRPDARVILTLSPIPLMATFRPISCLAANAISKAVLRLAIDELMSEGRRNLFYFPAYEMVTGALADAFEDDNRHPRQPVIDAIMACFQRHYCQAQPPHL